MLIPNLWLSVMDVLSIQSYNSDQSQETTIFIY